MQICKFWLLLRTLAAINVVYDLFFVIVIHCLETFSGFSFCRDWVGWNEAERLDPMVCGSAE
jgi:hypothetical protein